MYNPTIWQDHVTSPSRNFVITPNGDGTHTIARAGTVMQQGTPQDQVHFNNMERGILDAHLAIGLLLGAVQQNSWELERGTATLHNSMHYPFNSSKASIALLSPKGSGEYFVLADILSADGNPGEIVVSDRLSNGFKLEYTGSASRVTVKYTVIGGFLK